MRQAALFYACLFVLLASAVSAQQNAPAQQTERLRVAVTLSDIEPIVKAVGGDLVTTVSVLPSGADPHSFSPSATVMTQLQEAALIVYANPDLLDFERRLQENVPDIPAVTWQDYVNNGAALSDFPGQPQNAHGFWLDHGNARSIAQAVGTALVARGLPEETIRNGVAQFLAELDVSHNAGLRMIREAGIAGDTVVAAVPGVAYVVKNLGLHTGALLLREGAGFAGAAELNTIAGGLRSGQYKAVVCPASMREAKPGQVSRQLAEDTGSRVVYVRFLQTVEGESSYLAQSYSNAASLSRCAAVVNVVDPVSDLALHLLFTGLFAGFIIGGVAVHFMKRQRTHP